MQDEFKSYLELTGGRTELQCAHIGQMKIRVKNGLEVKILKSKGYNEFDF